MSKGHRSPSSTVVTSQSIPANAADDHVLPFHTGRAEAMGRIVRLGPSIDEILNAHAYPEPVARVLGEALALTAMLATTVKIEGRLILQTSTDGPLRMLVVNFDAPKSLRGYASFDDKLKSGSWDNLDQKSLLGKGHLALTIDPGGNLDRYQGIVALEGDTLTQAALSYFHQSEQLPTYLKLAVARLRVKNSNAAHNSDSNSEKAHHQSDDRWHWRAGGLLVQHIAHQGGMRASNDMTTLDEGLLGKEVLVIENDLAGDDEDENWRRTRILAATVEDHELTDPTLSSQRLLYRLFHEEGVRVNEPFPVQALCRCSRERVEAFIKNVQDQQLADLREPDGGITVTCEFCNSAYRFPPGTI